jgi:hypothetical protein
MINVLTRNGAEIARRAGREIVAVQATAKERNDFMSSSHVEKVSAVSEPISSGPSICAYVWGQTRCQLGDCQLGRQDIHVKSSMK